MPPPPVKLDSFLFPFFCGDDAFEGSSTFHHFFSTLLLFLGHKLTFHSNVPMMLWSPEPLFSYFLLFLHCAHHLNSHGSNGAVLGFEPELSPTGLYLPSTVLGRFGDFGKQQLSGNRSLREDLWGWYPLIFFLSHSLPHHLRWYEQLLSHISTTSIWAAPMSSWLWWDGWDDPPETMN